MVLPPQQTDGGGAYSRLSSDLPKVAEELRQVGLEQPLKLQAQRHNALQEREQIPHVQKELQTNRMLLQSHIGSR